MNICIYGASSIEIDKSYIEQVEHLGEALGKAGHTLVYGGGANGLMGAAARGFRKGLGDVIGVAPSFFNVDGVLFEDCVKFYYTETMRERKQIMEDLSDAFVAVPGGLGTFDELFEILALKQLGRHKKPVVIYNVNGYFDALISMFEYSVKEMFMTEGSKKLIYVCNTPQELLQYLENYSADDYDFSVMKKVEFK